MPKIVRSSILFVIAVFASLALNQKATAMLGESADSINSDRAALAATRQAAIAHDAYTVHQLRSDANIVREYVSPSGVIFGLAWNGLAHPDLKQLLGSYAGEYAEAMRQHPHKPGQRQLRVKSNQIVVEKWGHMRNLQGRAYVPALIPPGVAIDEIK